MDYFTFWIITVLAAVAVYRLLSRRLITPKARINAMLRRYYALQRTGLTEPECLMQLLLTRNEWKNLSHRFLVQLVSRLRSKEDVIRFISVSEDYKYQRTHYPELAQQINLENSMTEIACLFARFGFRLQGEGRYKEAEFVQKLALRLQPHQYFTKLPLADTYHATGRYQDALPLFEQGFASLEELEKNHRSDEQALSPAKCLGAEMKISEFRSRYERLCEACRKAAEGMSMSLVYLASFTELLC
jgi:tetratricopeptide (TPR) repeat protein